MNGEHSIPKIAYVLKTFPRLSETFILNEILGLERLGLKLRIFSLKSPDGGPTQSAVADVKARVTYPPELWENMGMRGASETVAAHLMLLLTRPARYMGAARFHFSQPGRLRWKQFLQTGYIARALDRDGYEHLHAHFANVPVSVAEVIHRMIGIPYSFTAHAKDIYLTPDQELARKIDGATCVLTCTAFNQRHLQARSRGTTPIRLAYHGVDMGRIGRVLAQPRDGANEPHTEIPLILSVGRFCEKKGFPYLIEACRILQDRGRAFQCKIVGYGELQRKLESMIARLGLDGCVSLPGPMTQDEVFELYRRATLFVLPCQVTGDGDRDGIPNVLMEAMASGLPVISTDVSGISELVKPMENGLLVQQRNPGAMADAITLLLEAPDLRRWLAENGRAKVLREFTLEGSAERVYNLLLEASGSAERRPVADVRVEAPGQ